MLEIWSRQLFMMHHKIPDDFVVGTSVGRSVKDLIDIAFIIGIKLKGMRIFKWN